MDWGERLKKIKESGDSVKAVGVKTGEDSGTAWSRYVNGLRGYSVPMAGVQTKKSLTEVLPGFSGGNAFVMPGSGLMEGRERGHGSFVQDPGERLLMQLSEQTARKQLSLQNGADPSLDPERQELELLQKEREYAGAAFNESLAQMVNGQIGMDHTTNRFRQVDGTVQFPSAKEQTDYNTQLLEQYGRTKEYFAAGQKLLDAENRYEAGKGLVYYTDLIDKAVADGDWGQANLLLNELTGANLTSEERDAAVSYIDQVTSRYHLVNHGGMNDPAYQAKQEILLLADTDRWEELYLLMNSEEGERYKEIFRESYGIDADSEESKRGNYEGLVTLLEATGDSYGYDTLMGSGENLKTQLANNTFLYRVQEQMDRASQSSTYSVQMGSYTRAQTAYYILDALAADLGVEDNGVLYNVDSPQTQYLLQYLKETCHVDLTGMDESNYRSMIRTAMDEQSQKAKIMGDVLKQEGFDIDAVREYYELSVQSGYEEVRQKSFEEWKENADAWDYIGVTALSVPFKAYIQPFESLATLAGLGGRGSDVNDPNTYVPMLGVQSGWDMIRSATAQAIEENTDWEIFGRNVASFAYTTGMSSVDSMVSGFSLGKASIFFMGMTAAGTEANNILARGGNRRQALYGGIAAGAIEAVTEYFSVDKLLENVGTVDSAKALFRSVGQQMFTEGTEEMSAEVLGIIVDAANMGNLSENSQAVQKYMAQGMSYDQARVQVLYDNIGQVVESGVSGAFSGGFSAGISGTVGYAANRGSNPSAEMPDQESTAVNDDPAEHTPEEMQVIEEYKKSTDSSLRNLFSSVFDGSSKAFARQKISDVSERQSNDASRLLGGDYSGYTNNINTNSVRHILNDHGPNGAVDKSLGDLDDAARIGYVLDHYDNVEIATYESGDLDTSAEFRNANNEPAPMLRYSKKVNGTYYVVEAIPESRHKKFWVVSAYMQKNTDDLTKAPDAQSLRNTPEASLPSQSSAEDIVTQTVENVNGEGLSMEEKTADDLYGILLDMGVLKGVAESIGKGYDPESGVSAEVYARGAGEAFLYGRAKFSEAEMLDKQGFAQDLSANQRGFAYRLGQVFQKNRTAAREAEIQSKKKTARKDGRKASKGDVQFVDQSIDRENLSDRQKVSVEALEKLAEALGAKFRLFQSETGKDGKPIGANGWYDPKTGEIYIDIQAGEQGEGTILFTAAHELTHFLYQWSPAKFKVLADFLVEQYSEKGQSVADLIRAQQAKARKNGRKLGWMDAYQEMVADSMETMLSDGKVIEKLAKLRARDKSLVQKIQAWFKTFVEKLRAAYRNMLPDTQEGRLVAEMVDVTERLQELFAEGLAEAGENYRAIGAQKNTAEEGGDVLYSLREGLKDDLEKVKNRTFEASKGEVEIGNTSDFLVNELDADPLAMYMPPTKAYRALVTEEQAIQDGQPTGDGINYHGLGVDGLYALLEKSEHPIAAFVSKPSEKDSRFDRIVLVTDYKIGQELGVVIIEVNSIALANKHRVSANKTITAYDKNNAVSAVQEAFAQGRLLYIDKKNGQLFDSGVKGSNCPTAISEGVRKKNIQDFWANVKWKKSGKQEMSFDGGQKNESAFAEALKNAGKLRSDRGNITTRSVLEEVDASQVKSEIERKHLLEYQAVAEKQQKEQAKLGRLQAELKELNTSGKKDARKIRDVKDEIIKSQNRIELYHQKLHRAENSWQLEKLIGREMNAARSRASAPVARNSASGKAAQIRYNDYGKDTSSVGAAKPGFAPVGTKLAEAVDKYGAIPAGENAAEDRYVEMPISMDGETKVSRVARSAAEAQMTPREFVPQIEQAVVDGLLSYNPDTNKDLQRRAKEWLEGMSSSVALRHWLKDAAKSGKLTKDDIARGILLYNNLCNAANNATSEQERIARAREAIEVLSELQNMATEAGQMVQAMRLMKRQAPEMQYYALQNSVKELNDKLRDRLGDKLPEGIKINEELANKWLEALQSADQKAIDAAAQVLYRDIAAQVPRTFLDKWNAWRYLCMLGNPKTLIRNTAGNYAFMPFKYTKDLIGSFGEFVAYKFGWIEKDQRTKSAKVLSATKRGRALLQFAKDDFKDVAKIATGSGKYSDQSSVSSELQEAIREAKRTFKLWGVRHWQKGTDWMMNDANVKIKGKEYNLLLGDTGFLKHHYATAFAHGAAARGYTVEAIQTGKISQVQLDSLRAYAINQAQKATYRDVNAFSSALRKLRFKGASYEVQNADLDMSSHKIRKFLSKAKVLGSNAGNFFLEGVLPFKSTPANVLVRAVEYSPVGLLKALSTDAVQLALGDISAVEYIERLSSGLTGSLIFGLGWLLSSLGLIVGGSTDEDDDRMGKQSYSLEVMGKSFTLDWLSPAAIPFFMGVEVQKLREEEQDVSVIAAILNSVGTAVSPMLEMSMLSGVQDMIDTITYGSEDSRTGQIMYAFFAQPFLSYLSQGIPTLLSQLANTLETEDEFTYVGDIGDQLTRNFTRSLVRIAEKVPGVSWRQQPFVDAYGRTQSKGSWVSRALASFISPFYTEKLRITEADREIRRLEDATGAEISPSRRESTVTVDGEKIRLDGDQYTAYATAYGQQYASMVGVLMSSPLYEDMSDAEKVEAIDYIDKLANEYGKVAAGVGYDASTGTYKKLFGLIEAGIPVHEAYEAKLYHDMLDDDRSLTMNQAAAQYANWVESMPWTDRQKQVARETYGGFGLYMFSDTEKYDSFAAIEGVSSDTALKIYNEVSGLEPETGYTSVRPVQKWEAVVSMAELTDTQQGEVLKTYMTDSQVEALELCMEAGVSAADFVALSRAKDTEGNKNGSWSQEELQAYLENSTFSRTQKAAIWEAFGKNWKTNPYK